MVSLYCFMNNVHYWRITFVIKQFLLFYSNHVYSGPVIPVVEGDVDMVSAGTNGDCCCWCTCWEWTEEGESRGVFQACLGVLGGDLNMKTTWNQVLSKVVTAALQNSKVFQNLTIYLVNWSDFFFPSYKTL